MIQNYKGEFTAIPFALEMSLNKCSNDCFYCFANLNNPDRKFEFSKFKNQIEKCQASKSLDITNYLISNRYALLLSNRSDIFSKSNEKIFDNVMDKLQNYPLTYQTKAGIKNENAKKTAKRGNEHWYISIPYLNDNIRNDIEPNASTINERLDFIDYLIDNNNDVCVGINPSHEFYINDSEINQLCKILKNKKVSGISFNPLHLNEKQKNNLTEKKILKLEKYNSFQFSARQNKIDDFWYLVHLSKIAENNGLEPYFVGYPFKSNYFKKAIELYGHDKTFPIIQEFINMLYDNNNDECEVYFEDLINFFNEKILKLNFKNIHSYIYSSNMGVFINEKMKVSDFMTLTDVMQKLWNIFQLKNSFMRYDCFYLKGTEKKPELDSFGNHIYIFKPLKLQNYANQK